MMSEELKRSRGADGLPKLPWWVELCFVQIGLPDRWLRSVLKIRKRTKSYIEDNKRSIIYLSFIIVTVIYVDPIIKEARYQNKCLQGSMEYLELTNTLDPQFSKNITLAISKRFCNGGDLD